ncbi:MAG: bifunctional riboflavin kinase/FAD synthetase, partial [Peptococcaceae bacterium]|nr:bifunctional riboflavin kinase/FAD synthetase [Peptococcaceae bacterium]
VMQPCYVDDEVVSSSAIRQYLQDGAIEKANALLGDVFTLHGEVVHGNQIGRTIGFPTANIPVPKQQMIPANGVYAAIVTVDDNRYPGILNIGHRPTVANGSHISIEVHLMNFDNDIYGKEISIAVCHFLRKESKFDGLDQLKAQLEKDKQNALHLFQENTCKTCSYHV